MDFKNGQSVGTAKFDYFCAGVCRMFTGKHCDDVAAFTRREGKSQNMGMAGFREMKLLRSSQHSLRLRCEPEAEAKSPEGPKARFGCKPVRKAKSLE